ncbi:hypothetical protein I4U23_011058 [Adineta vaga]|nr:hypothetical protein I4U23_011058 [Adineta vaga]
METIFLNKSFDNFTILCLFIAAELDLRRVHQQLIDRVDRKTKLLLIEDVLSEIHIYLKVCTQVINIIQELLSDFELFPSAFALTSSKSTRSIICAVNESQSIGKRSGVIQIECFAPSVHS